MRHRGRIAVTVGPDIGSRPGARKGLPDQELYDGGRPPPRGADFGAGGGQARGQRTTVADALMLDKSNHIDRIDARTEPPEQEPATDDRARRA